MDPTGAVVPGATVSLTNKNTGVTLTTSTDATGRYQFPAVNPADYSLTVTATGFQKYVVAEVGVEVTKVLTIPVKLKIGTSAQTVTVKEVAGAELQTTNASIGTTVGGNTLEFLPTAQRQVTSLLSLQPAVAPMVGNDIFGGQVAGAASDQTTFIVDGGDATDDLSGTNSYEGIPGETQPAPNIMVNVEATQEFRVVDAGGTSNMNRSQGGQISIVSKQGTNQFHGSVYEYYTGDALDARGYDLNTYQLPKPHTVNNRFGFTFGGPLLKNKLFFFGNYEGRRFRRSSTITANVPSALARQGILQFRNGANNVETYNLATSTACGTGSTLCDPRGIGIDPTIQQYWSSLPLPNSPGTGDGLNSIGYTHSYAEPDTENYGLLRLDYSINSRWHFFATYREQKIFYNTTDQVDLSVGHQQLISGTPVQPHFATFMLTGQIGSHFTTQTHGSYMRDFWGWDRAALANPSGVTGLGGTLQVSGEAQFGNAGNNPWSQPINFNTQQARARTWDGRDWYLAEDDSWLHGNHTFQFGGAWYFWNIEHVRTDDVLGGLTQGPIYWVSSKYSSSGTFVATPASETPPTCAAGQGGNCILSNYVHTWDAMYSSMLGLVDHSSQVATRNGQFQPNPLGTPLVDNVHVGSIYTYWQDIWQVKPTVTFTYGVSWGLQFPPKEINGKQGLMQYASNGQVFQNVNAYFQARQQAYDAANFSTLQGLNSFEFSPIGAVPGYTRPVNTYWGSVGPRIAVAWQPPFHNRFFGNRQTVIRAGYSIVWNRTNAVGLVMTPLLGTGLAQIVGCSAPEIAPGAGKGAGTFVGCNSNTTDAANAFRIGIDGNSLPMPQPTSGYPVVPGPYFGSIYGFNLDPSVTPPWSHNITFDIQRSFPNNWLVDVGYIGRFSRNLENGADLNASDMYAKDPISGQTLAQAFDAVSIWARNGGSCTGNGTTASPAVCPGLATQPFFENMIGPSGPSYCHSNFGSTCTAVAALDNGDAYYGSLGSFMEFNYNLFAQQPLDPMQFELNFWNYGGGWANYNAGFISVHKAFSQGLNFTLNYTWSHALGTQALNQQYIIYGNPSPYNQATGYGTALFDRRSVLNASWYYQLPFGHGQRFASGSSFINRIIGGWYSSGIWTLETGLPGCIAADGDYGDIGSGANNQTCAVSSMNLFGLQGRNNNVAGSAGIGVTGDPATGGTGLNIFANPAAVYNSLSRPLLTQNTRPFDPNYNNPLTWNVDLSFGKNIVATERYKAYFTADLFNAFNIMQPGGASLDMASPASFGVITGQGNSPRSIQLGLRFQF